MSSKVTTEKEQSPVLPYEIIVDIVTRVPRCYYPTISLVSKSFQSIIASHELYTSRSLLGRTEHYLYAVLYNYNTYDYRLCILRRKVNNNNHLVIIRSLPCMPCSVSYVPLGSKIYAVDSSSSLSIDCRSHKVQPNSRIPKHMYEKVPGNINGKIYVTENWQVSWDRWGKRVMVLDTETQMTRKPNMEQDQLWYDAVVMEDKIYMRGSKNSFVYVPKESKWESDGMLNSKDWENACAVGDLLYYYDVYKNKLRVYDPKQRCWRVVNGLEKSLPRPNTLLANMVSYDGKLAMFFHKNVGKGLISIWCAEIALERRQRGEIWGKVLWYDAVTDDGSFVMVKCLGVTM
ncbi:hypothetical protein EUTSA_v10029145mg [Eutrema salsugineum]|uniref:F-box domain-containing protein n=1 Tax=Eutrema salsugineum TaxID=72664 RepID=V4N0K0_EUTSA|nr:F-box/kelch-repeat protein At4g38940 [Eutrema salsugineum]ESQ38496.1 hypothetical protein EUTSA_v10029145mg [Eutrema salsugineum]